MKNKFIVSLKEINSDKESISIHINENEAKKCAFETKIKLFEKALDYYKKEAIKDCDFMGFIMAIGALFSDIEDCVSVRKNNKTNGDFYENSKID